MLSSFVQGHRPGRKHTCDQSAKGNVIEIVHSVGSQYARLTHYRHINVTKHRDRTPLPAALVMREAEEDWGRLNETGRNLRLAACAPCWFLRAIACRRS